MTDIKITHYKGLSYTPALILAMKANTDLLETNLSEPICSVGWDNNAILASIDDKDVGVITWTYSEWSKTVNIHIGWVAPEFRRLGIYRKLWDALVEKAKEAGAKHIIGSTHMDNISMREAAKALGRVELSVNLSYRLD